MNLASDELYEIFSKINYEDIPTLCQSNRDFANFCQSAAGMKLIQQKQRQYREHRVENLLNGLIQQRSDLNLDRFMKSMEKGYREKELVWIYPKLAAKHDYSFLIPEEDINSYWQIKRQVLDEFIKRHPEFQGKVKLSLYNEYDFRIPLDLYRQIEPEIEDMIYETGKRFLLSHYHLVPKIAQLTKTYIYLF